MLERAAERWPLHVFVNASDLPTSPQVSRHTIPLPRGPVLARAVLYTIFVSCAYYFSRIGRGHLTIASEGAFPFADICYSQYCHKLFLARHRDCIAGSGLRRMARILTHRWIQITEKLAFRSARVIVVPSQGIQSELQSTYPTSVNAKIRVIANPVDVQHFARPNNFAPEGVLKDLAIRNGSFVLSFCALGHFERKGLRLILEALALLRRTDICLIVVGGTPGEIEEYRQIAYALRVGDSVRFVGLQTDIRPYLWSSQAFVFPSAYEGFALACLQAAAAGLPLITTRINGVEEFIQHGVNGLLVKRTASSVADAIIEAAASPQKTASLGRQAQQDVQRYRKEIFQESWLKLLEELSEKC